MEVEQDDVGIARIEDFLDRIEDPHESILDSFQDDFAIVQESLGLDDEAGSEEYLRNSARAAKLEAQGGGAVPPGAARVSDGFRECSYKGRTDDEDLPVGEGVLTYTCGDAFTGTFQGGLRNRSGKVMSGQGEVGRVEGIWVNGFLEGRGREVWTAGGWKEAVYRRGCCHGFARTFGIASYSATNLQSFACYNHGLRVGWVYEGRLGGGYLVGQVDAAGELTGGDIAFIYPDFRTAVLGTFLGGVMVEGRQCRVVSSRQVGWGMEG